MEGMHLGKYPALLPGQAVKESRPAKKNLLGLRGLCRIGTVRARFRSPRSKRRAPVGSGTLARTRPLPIERRAEAVVIAWMRHQTTFIRLLEACQPDKLMGESNCPLTRKGAGK